ncbi:ATP-dependent RNA helicase DDX24/MAK5 [Angomonas deanei]|nr:ATP-dependent RNA helicase DDX24/MAK5 [Angomonas deanei]|eukprot:EPY40080.1 ATP-dependent RNA helicase DDX24/MAK5 [Angomonas deanei]
MEEMMQDIQSGVAVPLQGGLDDPRSLTDMLLQKTVVTAKESAPTNVPKKKKTEENNKTMLFPLSAVDDSTAEAAARLAAIEEEERRRREEELASRADGGNKNHYRHHGQNYVFWERVGLHPRILKALRQLHFTHPTPVQEEVLPNVLLTENTEKSKKAKANGEKDVVVSAETGSGKTLVFALPILQNLLLQLYGPEETSVESGRKRAREKDEATVEKRTNLSQSDFDSRVMHSLIVSPTRELALQINTTMKQLTAFSPDVTVGCIVGGMAAEKQQRILNRHPHILICTPGRLWDLSQKNEGCFLGHSISRRLKFVVLDEADKMLQSGKFEELKQLLERIHCEILPAGFIQEREEGAEAGEMPIAEGRWDAAKQKFVPYTEEELRERQKKGNAGNKKQTPNKKHTQEEEEEAEEEEEEEEEELEEEEEEEVAEKGKKGRRDLPRVIPMPPGAPSRPPGDHLRDVRHPFPADQL